MRKSRCQRRHCCRRRRQVLPLHQRRRDGLTRQGEAPVAIQEHAGRRGGGDVVIVAAAADERRQAAHQELMHFASEVRRENEKCNDEKNFTLNFISSRLPLLFSLARSLSKSSHAQAHAPFHFGEDGACLSHHTTKTRSGKADLKTPAREQSTRASRRRFFRISLFFTKTLEPQKPKNDRSSRPLASASPRLLARRASSSVPAPCPRTTSRSARPSSSTARPGGLSVRTFFFWRQFATGDDGSIFSLFQELSLLAQPRPLFPPPNPTIPAPQSPNSQSPLHNNNHQSTSTSSPGRAPPSSAPSSRTT